MKNATIAPLSFMLLFIVFISCQDKLYEKYQESVPVYMSYNDLRDAVKNIEPQALVNPGKIYFKDKYIFINEYFKGIHVINNQDPANPVEKVFIDIPGNVDMAIKENTLYVDSYIDLVAIDIADLNNIKEIYRIKDVFPYTVPTKKVDLTDEVIDQTKGVVVRWEVKEIEKEINRHPQPYPYPGPYYYYESYSFADKALTNSSSSGLQSGVSSGVASSSGIGGSMARFAIQNQALYVLAGYSIKVLDITNVKQPVTLDPVNNTWGIETIFLNGNYMYVGAQNGMTIYDVTDALKPKWVSNYSHFTSCDPVVVDGDYAYVTLRSGRTCRNALTNQLDVIDIKDKKTPTLIKSYGFTSPNGLGIDNKTLFICDGNDGLKIFNATDIYHITTNPIAQFKDIQATDVIPVNGLLFMIGKDGFYQYDYSNLTNVKLISKIEIKK